jgi:septum formation protein
MDRQRNGLTVILASGSPRRKALMREHGYRFRTVVSGVNESVPRGTKPSAMVKLLAVRKAVAVAKKHPDEIVIGADTTVFINGRIIGKPRNPAHAARMLRTLSGAWQKVYTGVAVAWAGGRKTVSGAAVSGVKMRRLTDAEIARASRKHLDKAGGYAVQERKDAFVERIRGDYDNVVGLPMRLVKRLLTAAVRRRGAGGTGRRRSSP